MKVVVIGSFPDSAKKRITGSFPADWQVCVVPPEDAAPHMRDAEVVIPEHIVIDARFLENAPALRLVQTGAGYDNVSVDDCARRGVRVCCAAGVNANAVAEHVMAFILCRYKNIICLDGFMRSRADGEIPDYFGAELSGKTVGIIGLGSVGRRVAALCGAFGMRVLGYGRRPFDVPGVRQTELDRLYAMSDVVTVHVPLDGSTRHMLGADAFRMMRRDALLINTSRGGVIDEAQLAAALKSGEIGGACLDVFESEPLPADSPLRGLPGVILTPHTAGYPDGVKYHEKRYEFFVRNITKLINGEEPDCAVPGSPTT